MKIYDRIYSSEAQKHLGYRDQRSFVRWCIQNNVGVLCDPGSNKRYVLRNEFEHAKNREAIRYLLTKYGKQEFHSILSSQMKLFSELKSATRHESSPITTYKPSAHHESEFLARLRKIKYKI
ncbi:MAG: hypothetical protein IPO63_10240 [Bacteroidetes bacterium]|nr:hypothetical protein [Bacteroidota bacterium]